MSDTKTVAIKDSHDKIQSMLLVGINNKLMDITDTQDTIQKALITLTDQAILINKRLDLSIEQQKLSYQQLKLSLEQQTLATKELQEEADRGEFLRTDGTVTTTAFTIIDTNVAPGHMVKGYTIKNDGPNNIFVGHNVAISSQVDADIVDVTTLTSRFDIILPNEDIKFIYNRRTIRNVHLLSQGGNSSFRSWLLW